MYLYSYVSMCVQLMKSIQTVSGKDLSHFMEQWVCRNGVPRFHVSFSYMRKKNFVELRLKQDLPRGYTTKFVVSEISRAILHESLSNQGLIFTNSIHSQVM